MKIQKNLHLLSVAFLATACAQAPEADLLEDQSNGVAMQVGADAQLATLEESAGFSMWAAAEVEIKGEEILVRFEAQGLKEDGEVGGNFPSRLHIQSRSGQETFTLVDLAATSVNTDPDFFEVTGEGFQIWISRKPSENRMTLDLSPELAARVGEPLLTVPAQVVHVPETTLADDSRSDLWDVLQVEAVRDTSSYLYLGRLAPRRGYEKDFAAGPIAIRCDAEKRAFGLSNYKNRSCNFAVTGSLVEASTETLRVQSALQGEDAKAWFERLPGDEYQRGFSYENGSLVCTHEADAYACVADLRSHR